MKRRICFNSDEIRALFFKKSLESFDFKRWKELRIYFRIPKSMLEFYRCGKLTLPEEIYRKLSKNINSKDRTLFEDNIEFLDSNWGNVKGGKITYSRYKSIFDEGRKKAIDSRKKEAADKFDINMDLSRELSYFIGLFIGDGFTNKYGGYYMVELTGDKRNEFLFYQNFIGPLLKKMFNTNFHIKLVRNTNALRFILYSKTIFKMITQRFKIPAGRKSRIVLIPREILESKQDIIKYFLRGLYDAEGCVFFDRRETYKKHYPRIELHMCNLALLGQVYDLLNKFGIRCVLGKSEGNLRVTIWGFEEVSKFLKEIGFSNPKQLEKLEKLKN